MIKVIIPSIRDHSAAFDSVLKQTKSADAIVIVKEVSSISKARNRGLELLGETTYIAMLDDDDTWKPEFLETMLSYMPDYDIVISYPDYGCPLKGPEYGRPQLQKALMRGAGIAFGSGIMWRKALFDRIGGFSEQVLPANEIWEMTFRAFFSGAKMRTVPELLWFQGQGQGRLSYQNTSALFAERKQILAGVETWAV